MHNRKVLGLLLEDPSRFVALATLVETEGSTYRRAGARMLVTADGTTHSSISGGCQEKDIVRRALALTGESEVVQYDTRSPNDRIWGSGSGCDGAITVRIERVTPRLLGDVRRAVEREAVPRVAIFGSGEDARALEALLSTLGWETTIADPTMAVVMTRNFVDDLLLLEKLLATSVGFIGLMGSRRRVAELLRLVPDDDRIHAPVGLDIGAETPEEIAVSIAAQLVAAAAHRDGSFLNRKRTDDVDAIHG